MNLHRIGLLSSRLHHFMLVTRLGSIRQAALSLNVAPSSISRTIKQLEDDVGTALFERTKQGLRLTSAGELLLYHAQQSNNELTRAMTEIGDLQGLRRGHVTVAVIESAARGILPDILEAFWVRHPDITVDIRVTGSQEAVNMVGQGDADIAIAFDVRVPGNARRIATAMLALGVLVPPQSELATRQEPLRVYDLKSERMILSDGSLALGESVDQMFSSSFDGFEKRSRTNSIAMMVDLCMKGQGIIVQTALGVQAEINDGALIFIPLSEARLQKRRLSLVCRSKRETSDAAGALSDALALAIEQLNKF